MKPKQIILSLLAASLTVFGCVYDYEPELPDIQDSFLVVDGDILAGMQSVFRFGRSMNIGQESNGDYYTTSTGTRWMESNLWDVYVEAEDGTIYPSWYVIPGIILNPPVVPRPGDSLDRVLTEVLTEMTLDSYSRAIDTRDLNPDVRCRLRIEYYTYEWADWEVLKRDTLRYASEWLEVQRTSHLDSVTTMIDEDLKTMHFNINTSGESSSRYYRWFARESWEYTAQLYAQYYYNPSTNEVLAYQDGENTYYCWNTGTQGSIMTASSEGLAEDRLSQYELYGLDNTSQKIAYLYCVDMIQESLSADAWRYWKAMKSNTTDVGGLFSPQPSECYGNIFSLDDETEIVLGYVNASTVSICRRFVSGDGFYRMTPVTDISSMPMPVDWHRYYYGFDYRPYVPTDMGGDTSDPFIYYEWMPRRCVDCQMRGGNKNKPSYWPNDHK